MMKPQTSMRRLVLLIAAEALMVGCATGWSRQFGRTYPETKAEEVIVVFAPLSVPYEIIGQIHLACVNANSGQDHLDAVNQMAARLGANAITPPDCIRGDYNVAALRVDRKWFDSIGEKVITGPSKNLEIKLTDAGTLE